MTKRGEPLPINQAMNRSRAKLGLELSTWMVIAFVSIAVFLVGFRGIAVLTLPFPPPEPVPVDLGHAAI